MGMTIIIALVTFVVGGLLVWFVMRVLMKSRYDAVIREAEKESEVMKQKKLLEVKEVPSFESGPGETGVRP